MRFLFGAFLFAAAIVSSAARAEIAPKAIAEVAAAPRADATLPSMLLFRNEAGQSITLGEAISARPSLLIFADYTCSNLCGPLVSLASQALMKSGLDPGRDFRLLVIGIDPKDTLADAARLKSGQVSADISPAALFLRGDERSIHAVTDALGYRYQYDPARDQFVHSADIYVLNPQGRVSRVLNGLVANGRDLRLALVAASQGTVGSIRDHLQLICYGFDPVKGIYSVAVNRILFAACCLTAMSLAGLILLLMLSGARRA